jgi:RNA polymerase sigma-70 factor (ECF subfamily)
VRASPIGDLVEQEAAVMSSVALESRPVRPPTAEFEVARSGIESERSRALEVFLARRTALFRIAFRITGDAPRAEDCVQEAWLRWQLTDRADITNPSAFLTTMITHLAINLIQTATLRRETPSDSLVDELVDRAPDPAERVQQSLDVADMLRMLMARLTRPQLTAYLLRKGFDYSYVDIARLLRTSIPNARQLIRRAQARIAVGRDRPVGRGAHRRLVSAFLTAARIGDLSDLERLLIQA